MSGHLCICSEFPKLTTRTRTIIVMHRGELATSSNTARLAQLSMPESCEIRIRGDLHAPMSEEGLLTPPQAEGVRPPTLLLFPSEDSIELTPEWVASQPNAANGFHLIVPDGSWKQASRVPYRVAALKDPSVIAVRLPPGPPSQYLLRVAPRESAVCTIEAIARALGILEGPERGPEVQAALEEIFHKMVERVRWSRGDVKTADCRWPIPEAAVQSFFEAGKRGTSVQ